MSTGAISFDQHCFFIHFASVYIMVGGFGFVVVVVGFSQAKLGVVECR